MNQTSDNQASVIRWVVMGVCGCGKSTVGLQLADAKRVTYIEGDAFHPPASVAKMSAGEPLNDDDRIDWLRALAAQIGAARAANAGLVLSCSALKRRYRDLLRAADPALRFAHLHGPHALIAARLAARQHHFMPPLLLDSQMAALEPLQHDEAGLCLDIGQAPDRLVRAILANERGTAEHTTSNHNNQETNK